MNNNRLIRMIHLAMYEQVDGKEDIAISKYFRRDYIAFGLFKNIVLVTIAFFILLGFIALYNLEFLATNFSNINFQPLILGIVIAYLLVVGIFSVIVFVIRGLRYEKAAQRANIYDKKLYELEKIYILERKAKRNGKVKRK